MAFSSDAPNGEKVGEAPITIWPIFRRIVAIPLIG